MLSINTNLSSLIAQQSLSSSTTKLNQAIERMSTGFKINHAKDNAANYSISTNLTTKISAYMVAEDNVAMGLDMLSTAEESLGQINDKLTRLRDLATQAGNGTYGAQSLAAINSEANALVDEIERLYNTSEYNSKSLFIDKAAQSGGVSYSKAEVAEMTSISGVDSFTSGEFYSISTDEELAKLAILVNSGVDTTGVTFVLANDIDLNSWCDAHAATGGWEPIGYYNSNTDYSSFKGSFDGNGYIISNLKINDLSTEFRQGLFGCVEAPDGVSVSIKNIGLDKVNISTKGYVAGLVSELVSAENGDVIISNNFITGTLTSTDTVCAGLIGTMATLGKNTITNNYANVDISASSSPAGGLIADIFTSNSVATAETIISNNFSTGNVSGNSCAGGFIGFIRGGASCTIKDNFTSCDVFCEATAGGFIGQSVQWNPKFCDIINCYSTGKVEGATDKTGGFVGLIVNAYTTITDCASVQSDNFAVQMGIDEIEKKYTLSSMGFTKANGWTVINGVPVLSWQKEANIKNQVDLQVGINSNESSGITTDTGFSLLGIERFRRIGLSDENFLSKIDVFLNTVSDKATALGSAQNRLESALDEISTAYENLVSTRSTIRDADIAEESSAYIRQQILQQASATLLATANQSPSIALQLI